MIRQKGGLVVTSPSAPDEREQLAQIRQEIRFEIGWLHDRVNALLAAEAFLTIAYTAAMSNGAAWGARFAVWVGPLLAVLGLLLAVLAWPGVAVTVRLVLEWTAGHDELLERNPGLWPDGRPWAAARRAVPGQRRSLLFFRAVPVLFTVVWTVLLVIALVVRR